MLCMQYTWMYTCTWACRHRQGIGTVIYCELPKWTDIVWDYSHKRERHAFHMKDIRFHGGLLNMSFTLILHSALQKQFPHDWILVKELWCSWLFWYEKALLGISGLTLMCVWKASWVIIYQALQFDVASPFCLYLVFTKLITLSHSAVYLITLFHRLISVCMSFLSNNWLQVYKISL